MVWNGAGRWINLGIRSEPPSITRTNDHLFVLPRSERPMTWRPPLSCSEPMRPLWISTCLTRTSKRRWRPCRVSMLPRLVNCCLPAIPTASDGVCRTPAHRASRLLRDEASLRLSGGARLRTRRRAGRCCRERSEADRLPRDEAGYPPLNDGGHRAVSKVRVRAHRALLRDPRDRHDFHAPLSHRALGARVRASNLTRRGGLQSAVPGF